MRLFISVPASGPFLDRMLVLRKRLMATGADVKWADPDQLHFTLHFLGETDSGMADKAANAVAACADVKKFRLRFEGIGAFPSLAAPKILWAGAEDMDGGLATLVKVTGEKLAGFGFALDSRPFVPHLTLGRVRSSRGRNALSEKAAKLSAENDRPVMDSIRVSLMSSTLFPTGPKHEEIYAVELRG